ncbi:MAG: hypothetical protein B7Z02_10400 [Rhodobacterales bacterium 32-67-9]|nr:MAG: hypothetical protein B7Z02_10400 [Rhodobacterales bacterium 32-67-9]
MFLRLSAVAVLCLTSSPAGAVPATPEGAARVEAALRTYFGPLDGVVEVVPEGETYALTLDATPVIALGKEAGITGAVSPFHLTLTDLGDGKWSVAEEEPFALTLDVSGVLSLDASAGATRFTGIFDEALLAFTSSEAGYEDFRVKERFTEPGRPETVVDYRIDRFDVTTSAAAAPGGGVDGTMRYAATGLSEIISVAAGEGLSEPMQFEVSAAQYDVETTTNGLRTEGILGLIAWLVAHPSEEAVRADFDGLKDAIRAALPFWNSLTGTGEIQDIDVTTPFGAGGAESMSIAVDFNGVVADGRLRETVAIKGLDLPEALMPDWVPALLPDEVTFDVAASGFDLATPAQILLDEIALDTEPAPDMPARLVGALLPAGKVNIALGPQGAASPIYTLDIEGALDAGPGQMPVGSVTIGATGIEAVLEALAAAPEDVRAGAVPGLMMMRGIAKPAGVGRFVWVVEMTPDGKVLVNGLDMSALMAGQQ